MDSLVKEADELKTIYNRLQFCAGANFLDRWGVWFDELSRMEKYLKSGSRQLSELRALVFANFLRVSVEFPFVRMSIGNKVSIVVSNIVSSHGARTDGFLYVLQAFLLNYPRACSSWHEQMRSFVFSKFTSTFSEVRKTAALTFALLPRCKYSKKDAGPCLAWFSQMMRTVATIHDVAVTLTVNDHTNSCMLNLPENVERFPIDASSVDFTDLCRIIESLLWSAVHMLSLEFMSVVDVPSNSIIHLFACLCELFWLRSSVCSDLIVTFLEPCFVLLSRTVRLLKIEFVPLCRPMVDLLFSLLNADAPSDGAYIFLLRRYVYDVLSTVCSVLGACSKLQDRFADLMPLIKKELQLGMTISHPKSEPVKKSKRQRKALGVTDSVLDQAVEKCFSLTCAVDTAVSCCDMLDQALLHF
ncbi:unnamed protein product, partial [Soboliphyme baturini]|uniref:DUF2428 domain-containing protein n=1 Tax=Soboliphyme baturini TaxID=241478 RepID=A0A183IYH8_9BILA